MNAGRLVQMHQKNAVSWGWTSMLAWPCMSPWEGPLGELFTLFSSRQRVGMVLTAYRVARPGGSPVDYVLLLCDDRLGWVPCDNVEALQ